MWLQRERKKLCYLKWFEAWGGHLELNAILYQSLSKIRSNSKLPSIIVTNISRSPPHTTSWFTEVRHPHLKTNRQGLLSHVHILIVSKSNLKLQVFGLFSRFVRTLTIKISSSEEPASSTSIHRVRNGDKLVILFHPFPKNITKRCWSPRRALKISKWRQMRRTSFIWACANEMIGWLAMRQTPCGHRFSPINYPVLDVIFATTCHDFLRITFEFSVSKTTLRTTKLPSSRVLRLQQAQTKNSYR